jgi:hypothetical protein
MGIGGGALRVAVGSDLALKHRLDTEEAEPVRRQLGAARELRRIEVEGAGGAAHRHQPDIVLDGAHAADPGPQILHRLVHPAHRGVLRGAGKSHAEAKGRLSQARSTFERDVIPSAARDLSLSLKGPSPRSR